VDHRVRLAARHQLTVGLVRAVRVDLERDAQPQRAAGLHDFRTWKREQDQRLVERGDRLRERVCKLGTLERHVEERAVRLDVLHRDAFGRRDAGDRCNLIEDEVLGLPRRHVHLAPAEADEIREPGMRADGDAVRFGGANRVAQDRRIAAVKPRRDIRGRDRFHEAGVVADLVGAEGFADVRVHVYSHNAQRT